MILGYFLSLILLYKYAALFLINFLASLVVPLPATALLMATGAFAFQGYFNFPEIALATFLGSIAGDFSGYFLARVCGWNILKKIGFRRLLDSRWFLETEQKFSRHAGSWIFLTRFLITWLGASVNILSGLAKVSVKKFLFFDIAGELIYVLIFGGIGYVFADIWQSVSQVTQNLTGILAVLALIYILYHLNFRKKKI